MPDKEPFVWLSMVVVVATAGAIFALNDTKLSSIGTIVAAAGSLLAVIWFSGSLRYQAQQLSEQQIQFAQEFRQLREDARRSALLMAREILKNAETKSLALNPSIKSLSELMPLYLRFSEFKDIMESDDPLRVQSALDSWIRKEGPAMTLMRGLKSAAQVYFLAIGREDIDFSKEPDEFVFVYGSQLWTLPFFEEYQASASMLVELMVRLEPGRRSAVLASFAVMAKLGNQKLLKMDSIREDIRKHVANGYPLPKIAESL